MNNRFTRSNTTSTTKTGGLVKYVGNRKFIQLPELQFDVRQGRAGDIVFPAGTKNVWCSFRTGPAVNVKNVGLVKLNVYMKNGIIAHA